MECMELRKLAEDCMVRGGEPVGEGPPELELRPLDFWSFLYFMRRFWNQILIWRSDRLSRLAISTRRGRHRYRLKWNSFSSSTSWALVYAVRARLDEADDPPVGLFSPLLPLSAPPEAKERRSETNTENNEKKIYRVKTFRKMGGGGGVSQKPWKEKKGSNTI